MFSRNVAKAVMDWHKEHGGHLGRPAGHALKVLDEVVELCVAAGASQAEIEARVKREIIKADAKGELDRGYTERGVREEIGDAAICLLIISYLHGLDFDTPVIEKLPILHNREWRPNKDGVLMRPDRIIDETGANQS